ncbi:MAG: hypothetical protein H7178_06120 [Chitinophagaceae bacterium]|nr:hypothetical protein [Chitinophagaceae bacterium]
MMFLKKSIAIALLFNCFVIHSYSQSWTSKYVIPQKDGSLQYLPDEQGNIIPDFSKVGYNHGLKNIPTVPVAKIVEPAGNNSMQAIQTAIDELAKQPLGTNGFRGAILLKKGSYNITGTITIGASGIVLRGEGMETKLVATGKGQRSLISVNGSGNIKASNKNRTKIVDKYVPVGAKSFSVEQAGKFKVGDKIIVFRPGTSKWIADLRMDQIEVRDSGTKQWDAKQFNLEFEREITAITGNKIFIDNPIVMPMEEQYGGGEIYQYSFAGRLYNVGIEDMYCESEFIGNEDEDHGWNAIEFNRIENGWVRNVTSKYFGYSCVNLGGQAKNIVVDSCKCLDAKSKITGGRRYSFNNDGQQNLIMNCFASDGRHDYVTGSKVCGPNVFYNCRAEKTHADIGPHHRWATGTLYDNIVTDGEINIQDRGNWGTGHGWSGSTQVVWNCRASKAAIQNPYVTGKNYVVGLKAIQYEGRLKNRPQAEWDNALLMGVELLPTSLFLAQKGQIN